uniref:Uncharacterized protein n=1 Tax=Oryza barthii TaxID=65489 RepID=A0A0D3GF21_9ORYZ
MPSENVQKKVHANGLDVAPVYKLMKTSIYRESFIAWKNKSSWTKGPKMGRAPSSSIPLRTVACGKKKEAELMLEAEIDASMHRIRHVGIWQMGSLARALVQMCRFLFY